MHGHDAPPPGSLRATEAARTLIPSVQSRNYRIREGPSVNVDVTAAGATLALGMTFMKSNNASVAAQLRIPDSMYALHCVRPDLIPLLHRPPRIRDRRPPRPRHPAGRC